MKKIAIIKVSEADHHHDDYYDSTMIINSITDWKEVDDATYDILRKASYHQNFRIIEQPNDIDSFILNTVDDYLAMLDKQKKAEEQRKIEADKRRAESAEKRRQKAILKLAKDEASEKELLATLMKKHPDVAVK